MADDLAAAENTVLEFHATADKEEVSFQDLVASLPGDGDSIWESDTGED